MFQLFKQPFVSLNCCGFVPGVFSFASVDRPIGEDHYI